MNVVDTVQAEFASYMGMAEQPLTELDTALAGIVANESARVLQDEEALSEKLREAGLTQREITRVRLMTQVTGYDDLVSLNTYAPKNLLDRYVANALSETGLSRGEVLRITRSLALAAGVAQDFNEEFVCKDAADAPKGFTVPTEDYGLVLLRFGADYDNAMQRGFGVSGLDTTPLEPLVAAGIPRAMFYQGSCLLHRDDGIDSNERALELLSSAADQGDALAMGELADYWYEQGNDSWSKAWALYTSISAGGMQEERRKHALDILNHGRYNKHVLERCRILLAFIAVSVVVMIALLVGPLRILAGILSVGLSVAVLVLGTIRWRAKPYENVYLVPSLMLVPWALFMALCSIG